MATEPNLDSTPIWRKSHTSGGNSECVEVAKFGSSMLVRDSRVLGTILEFSPTQWRAFVHQIKEADTQAERRR